MTDSHIRLMVIKLKLARWQFVPREKKNLETRNKISEITGRLFKEKGFENTTVDEITKKAEIGKGTFFNYYPAKEALLVDFAIITRSNAGCSLIVTNAVFHPGGNFRINWEKVEIA